MSAIQPIKQTLYRIGFVEKDVLVIYIWIENGYIMTRKVDFLMDPSYSFALTAMLRRI